MVITWHVLRFEHCYLVLKESPGSSPAECAGTDQGGMLSVKIQGEYYGSRYLRISRYRIVDRRGNLARRPVG